MAIKLPQKQKNSGYTRPAWHKRAIFGLVGLGLVALGWHLLLSPPPQIDSQTVEQAIYNTFGAPSYRFTTVATVLLDGEQRLFSQLSGEKSGADRHIQGELLGTPLNIYLAGGALYQQNALDKSWRQVAQADLREAQKLVGEIMPESNFAFTSLGELNFLGREEIDGRKLQRVEFKPELAEVWLKQHFTEVVTTLWLDEAGQYIVRARSEAVSVQNRGVKLVVENSFGEFGENIEIKAPL